VGLVDLKTDLKSLKYGTSTTVEDLPFAQPYVTVPIPQNNEPLTQIFLSVSAFNQPITFQNIGSVTGTILKGAFRNAGANMFGLPNISPSPNLSLDFNLNPRQAGTGGPDFLVRGGLLFPLIAARDIIRVGKTLASTKGLLFTTKQKLLQTTGLKPEYLQNVGTGAKVLNFLTQKGGYNPLNTLAQVGVVGLGGHLTRDGAINNIGSLLQSGEPYEKGKYISYIKNQQSPPLGTIGLSQNRLLGFYEQNQVRQKGQIISFPITNPPDVLYTVFGGPDSVLGFGNTTIRTTEERTGLGNQMLANDPDAGTNILNPYLTYTQQDIYNTTPVSQGGTMQDFRATLRKNYPAHFAQTDYASRMQILGSGSSYIGGRIESRYWLGDPGNKQKFNEAGGDSFTQYEELEHPSMATDLINALEPVTTTASLYDYNIFDDLVNFTIEGVDTITPSNSQILQFRAYLGNISDSYTANWSDTRYVGRAEKFYTYQGFDRQMSLSWTVAAQSYAEMNGMYRKLQELASYTAPSYGKNGYMRAPIVRLTIGKLYYRLPGIITNLSFEITNETPWEIGDARVESGVSFASAELLGAAAVLNPEPLNRGKWNHPHVIQVSSFNFIPIHQRTPQYQVNFGQIS